MKRIPFYVADSFTTTPFAGNPAGVFFDMDGTLTNEQMRRMAGEVHLESAFVRPSVSQPYALRYFTGVTEVPFCGHATVAAVTAMFERGEGDLSSSFSLETPPGLLSVTVHAGPVAGSPYVTMGQQPAVFSEPVTQNRIATVQAALGFTPNDMRLDLPIQAVSTGTPWLIVPVQPDAIAQNGERDFPAIDTFSRFADVWGFYIFATRTVGEDRVTVWSRCFAPRAGLNEDPVTGSGAGALGAYLAKHLPGDHTREIHIEQGIGGQRQGTATVTVSSFGKTWRSLVRGTAVIVADGHFTLP
jgi:PhzF family phenazine biosynthesis protein